MTCQRSLYAIAAPSADAVEHAVAGSDAVVSALGHAKGAPDDILARATANVIAAMRADGVDRLVVLSSPESLMPRTGRASSTVQRACCCAS
jgi:putative NADH-flavin reductase